MLEIIYAVWFGFLIGLLIGLSIGKKLESWRWRKNANEPDIRLNSGGRLYKVKYEETIY